MRCRLAVIVVVTLLILSQTAAPPRGASAATSGILKLGMDRGHSNLHVNSTDLSGLTSLLAVGGVEIVYNTGTLNQSFLTGVDVLIVSSPVNPFDLTELASLTTWYNSGGRLWLSAGPDGTTSIQNLNSILRAINSRLGVELGYISDPVFNLNSTAGTADDVLVPIINHKSGVLTGLTTDVRTIYAHQPVPIIAYNGSSYDKYSPILAQNSTAIAQTSSAARVSNASIAPLLAYAPGEEARFPIVAVEESVNGKLALTGAPLFSQWEQTFEYRADLPYDNRIIAKNLITWLTDQTITGEFEAGVQRLRETGQPLVLIYTGSGSQHVSDSELQPFLAILTDMGFNARTFDSLLSFDSIRNATAIVIQAPHELITSVETDPIRLWLQQGNKLLILSSKADYSPDGNAPESTSLNRVLEDIGSALRFEPGSVTDPEVNMAGNPYLGLTSLINHNTQTLANLTRNIRSLYLQFGTIIAGGNSTRTQTCCFYPLENQTYLDSQTNVTWIARTSNQSTLLDLGSDYALQAHNQTQRGSYIVAAQERYRQDTYNDTVLLLGGPIFSSFSGLLDYPTVYGYPVDNLLFIRNIFTRLLKDVQIRTEISVTATPLQLLEGGNITLNIHYSALQISTSDISRVDRVPVTSANVSVTLRGTNLRTQILPNQTYTATGPPRGTGSVSWSVSVSAKNYQPQVDSGTVQVDPLPTRFTFYILSIPIVIFIAVTIAVIARKTR